jgi:hypothetical protein
VVRAVLAGRLAARPDRSGDAALVIAMTLALAARAKIPAEPEEIY